MTTAPYRGTSTTPGGVTTAYRDPLERSREILAELTEALAATLPAVRARDRVVGRRAARIVFGAIGVGGAALVAGAAAGNAYTGWPRPFAVTEILCSTWLVAAAGYLFTNLVAMVVPRSRNPARSGSVLADVTRFGKAVDARRDGRFLGALSLALPAIAVSLLMPLTLHLGFWLLMGDGRGAAGIGGFDEWISMSLVIVGHAHLALAFLAGRFALRASRTPPDELVVDGERGFKALAWTVLVAAIPGIVLFAIPPALVAVTGIAFVPFLWMAIKRVALHERTALHDAGIEIV